MGKVIELFRSVKHDGDWKKFVLTLQITYSAMILQRGYECTLQAINREVDRIKKERDSRLR